MLPLIFRKIFSWEEKKIGKIYSVSNILKICDILTSQIRQPYFQQTESESHSWHKHTGTWKTFPETTNSWWRKFRSRWTPKNICRAFCRGHCLNWNKWKIAKTCWRKRNRNRKREWKRKTALARWCTQLLWRHKIQSSVTEWNWGSKDGHNCWEDDAPNKMGSENIQWQVKINKQISKKNKKNQTNKNKRKKHIFDRNQLIVYTGDSQGCTDILSCDCM